MQLVNIWRKKSSLAVKPVMIFRASPLTYAMLDICINVMKIYILLGEYILDCICCDYKNNYEVLFESEFVVLVAAKNETLVGSCFIIPKAHKETPFDLSNEEWLDTKKMLDIAKAYIEEKYKPDGYNIGWNIGSIGGQFVFHSHLHVIPRFQDEPYAGKGIRHWFTSEENKRPNV